VKEVVLNITVTNCYEEYNCKRGTTLPTFKDYIMGIYGEVKVKFHTLLSALDRGEWSVSYSG